MRILWDLAQYSRELFIVIVERASNLTKELISSAVPLRCIE
jgi:hypothetical protein